MSKPGHAASPQEIIASCKALQAHIQKVQDDAEQTIKAWEQSLKDQELAEKRRLAPGWLDRDEKILQPERTSEMGVSDTANARAGSANIMDQLEEHEAVDSGQDETMRPAGDELDRAFGDMGIQKE